MSVHLRPKLRLFVPYTTKARLCGSPYVNTGEVQTDLSYVLEDLSGTHLYGPADLGVAATNANVTALALTVGVSYTAKVRYKSASGYSAWSPPYVARVFDVGFDLTPATSPALPGATPVTLAIPPSFRVEVERDRGHVTHVTEAGQTSRRLITAAGERKMRLEWSALTSDQRDTVTEAIEDALGYIGTSSAVRGLDFSTVPPATPAGLVGFIWLPFVGTIKVRDVGPALWEVSVVALEVRP